MPLLLVYLSDFILPTILGKRSFNVCACVCLAWINLVKKQHYCIRFLVVTFAAKACITASNAQLLLYMSYYIFTVRHYANAVYAIVVFVCLSVCLSV